VHDAAAWGVKRSQRLSRKRRRVPPRRLLEFAAPVRLYGWIARIPARAKPPLQLSGDFAPLHLDPRTSSQVLCSKRLREVCSRSPVPRRKRNLRNFQEVAICGGCFLAQGSPGKRSGERKLRHRSRIARYRCLCTQAGASERRLGLRSSTSRPTVCQPLTRKRTTIRRKQPASGQ
jgi:hypothetical protein